MRALKPRYGFTVSEMDKLYGYWYRLGRRRERDSWETVDQFLKWAAETGYIDGMWLVPIDSEKPLAADNAQWRRKLDLQPGSTREEIPEKHPCPDCPSNKYCVHICTTRAKWWDVQMEKVRKGFGV